MTTHREKLLGQARADLTALPDLVAELARLIADRHHDITEYGGKVIGSPAPLQLPVVHLTDVRHKPRWHGEDPRHPCWALTWYDRANDERTAHTTVHLTEAAAWRAFHRVTGLPAPLEAHQHAAVRITPWRARDQYGAAALLETWVRVLADELVEQSGPLAFPDLTERATVRSECSTLIEHWSFISEQQWAEELALNVAELAASVRVVLGIRPEPKYSCPQCGNPAYMQPGGILACTEVPDHDIVVRDLDQQMRRRPALPTKDICEEFGVEPGTLRVWKHRRKITAVTNGTNRDHWFPWDVFCLLNPSIAEGFEARDEVEAG